MDARVAAAQDVTGREEASLAHAANAPLNARSRAGCSIAVEDGDAETRICSFFGIHRPAKAQRQNRVVAHLRFGRRGAHATVQEVLARAIAASQH